MPSKKRKASESPSPSDTSGTATPPPEIKDFDKWTDGDFEVITADHWRFRVPSYHLFSARCVHFPWPNQLTGSSVFRDAPFAPALAPAGAADGIKYSVTLRDDECESAIVFEEFLMLVTEPELDQPPFYYYEWLDGSGPRQPERYFRHYLSLDRFFRIWGCTAASGLLHHQLFVSARTSWYTQASYDATLTAFVIGATRGNEYFCHKVLDEHDKKVDKCAVTMSRGSWPPWVRSSCPPPFLAALVKARAAGRAGGDLGQAFLVAFKRLSRRRNQRAIEEGSDDEELVSWCDRTVAYSRLCGQWAAG
jgi:hypothetical protein